MPFFFNSMADSKGQQGKIVITQSRYSNAWISSANDIFFTVNDVAQAYWPTSGFYYILLSGWANCEGYETPSWLAGTDRTGISSALPRQLEMRLSESFPVKEKAVDALSTEKYSISWPCSLLSLFPMDIMIKSPREDQVYCLGASTLLSKV